MSADYVETHVVRRWVKFLGYGWDSCQMRMLALNLSGKNIKTKISMYICMCACIDT